MHLERYGRLIFGDTYIAMKHGRVPPGVYDMRKDARPQTGFYRYREAADAFATADPAHTRFPESAHTTGQTQSPKAEAFLPRSKYKSTQSRA